MRLIEQQSHKGQTEKVVPLNNGLQGFISNELKEGIDYGKVPGYSKPTLLKPGAEKVCQYMKLSIEYKVEHRYEEWQKGLFHFEVRVMLRQKDGTLVVVEGIGSCNTKEEKFASQNPYSIINTVLKMAKKRALVDAVLNVSATSGIFTQDIEELPNNNEMKGGEVPITKNQLKKIHQLVKEQGMSPATAKEMMKMMFDVDHSTKLSKIQASSFIEDLLVLNES